MNQTPRTNPAYTSLSSRTGVTGDTSITTFNLYNLFEVVQTPAGPSSPQVLDTKIAKLVLVVAKTSWQFDESLVQAVMRDELDEKRLIRILAFAAYSAAKRLAQLAGEHLRATTPACLPNDHGNVASSLRSSL